MAWHFQLQLALFGKGRGHKHMVIRWIVIQGHCGVDFGEDGESCQTWVQEGSAS